MTDRIFDEFITKLENLTEGKKLKCSFGPTSKFQAGKLTARIVKVNSFKNNPPYQYYIREIFCTVGGVRYGEILSFTTSNSLSSQLLNNEDYQRWYAENCFTGKVQFTDNYKQFLNSFE